MNAKEQQLIFEEWLEEHRGLCFKVVRAFAFNPHDQRVHSSTYRRIPSGVGGVSRFWFAGLVHLSFRRSDVGRLLLRNKNTTRFGQIQV